MLSPVGTTGAPSRFSRPAGDFGLLLLSKPSVFKRWATVRSQSRPKATGRVTFRHQRLQPRYLSLVAATCPTPRIENIAESTESNSYECT